MRGGESGTSVSIKDGEWMTARGAKPGCTFLATIGQLSRWLGRSADAHSLASLMRRQSP